MLVPSFLRSVPPGGATPPPPGVDFLSAEWGDGLGGRPISYAPGDGGGFLIIVCLIDNAVGDEYADFSWNITAGDPITATGAGNINGQTISPISGNQYYLAVNPLALGNNISGNASVTLKTAGGVPIATRTISTSTIPKIP